MKESDLYPLVAEWIVERYGCFDTSLNKGTRHGRIDVIGLRDVGGDLSGRSELISIEVKAGRQPFATAVGQAHGYSVCADRTYLADVRANVNTPYDDDEKTIADRLGVGLIAISEDGRVIREIISSPLQSPLEGLRLTVLEQVGYAECSLCQALFKRSEGTQPFGRVKRQGNRYGGLRRAIEEEKGYVYWLSEASARDRKRLDADYNYRRRYVCPDCTHGLFGELYAGR